MEIADLFGSGWFGKIAEGAMGQIAIYLSILFLVILLLLKLKSEMPGITCATTVSTRSSSTARRGRYPGTSLACAG